MRILNYCYMKQIKTFLEAHESGDESLAVHPGYSQNLMNGIRQLDGMIGNTRMHKLNYPDANLYTKLECQNFFGSIKDRPALYIIKKAIEQNLVQENTTIIESTSGNFGISLASICQTLRLKFISVIDPNISIEKEKILKLNNAKLIKVTEPDKTGGFLLNRIRTVQEYIRENQNSYTPNQYENPNNYMAYYYTLGQEISAFFTELDYAFISVSTGGTITGVSNRLKEQFKNVKIIAVDVEGSLIFGDKPRVRKLSGMGASMRTQLINKALIDDFIILSESEIIKGCRNLLTEHNLFLGGSSGAAYVAADRVLKKSSRKNLTAIFISPDAGSSYLDTIYNNDWVTQNILP